MDQADTPGSVADQAALFDDATAPAGRARKKAQPAKRAPRKATLAATEVTTPPASAPVAPAAKRTAAKPPAAEKKSPPAEKPAKTEPAKAAKTGAPASKRAAKTTATTTTAAKPSAADTAEPSAPELDTAQAAIAEPAAAKPRTTRPAAAKREPAPDQTEDSPRSAPPEPPSAEVPTPQTPPVHERPLWEAVVAEPRRSVDHAALAAVREYGPAAQRWLDLTRQRYPAADPDALARLAAHEYATAGGRRTAAIAGAKLVGPIAVTGTLMRTQAEVVLAIAGAYGLDPTHPDRAHDLTTLLHVRSVGPVLSLVARVLADRAVPFGGAVAALAQQRRATADVAQRARGHFRRYRPGM